ncbi:Zn-ribbon domain-containing OB-fold protein [Haloglomus litoreum]|uniref:Zn-ribbon domain-containing OB-fold protein n=1 Tax=Haloglomus litoreum TaxID=3034026 RepID=UPI0023E77FF4|nr:OB-fold domain-containing protein [Haloglomus sp. DT116]
MSAQDTEDVERPATLGYHDWAAAVREGRLLGQACEECGHVSGVPSGACQECGARDLTTVELPTEGTVYSETTINVPPEQFEERGYQVAVVDLGDARGMVRIEGDHVDIGDEVALSGVIDTDDDHPAPTFEPAE